MSASCCPFYISRPIIDFYYLSKEKVLQQIAIYTVSSSLLLRIPAATETTELCSPAAQPCPALQQGLLQTLHSFAWQAKTNAQMLLTQWYCLFMKHFCTKIAPCGGLSFTSQLPKEVPTCSPVCGDVCRRKHVTSFSSLAINVGGKQVKGQETTRKTKVVSILQNVWPFDSPRDDHEGADRVCSSPEVSGWLVLNALAGITCKQQREQFHRAGFLILCWVHLNKRASCPSDSSCLCCVPNWMHQRPDFSLIMLLSTPSSSIRAKVSETQTRTKKAWSGNTGFLLLHYIFPQLQFWIPKALHKWSKPDENENINRWFRKRAVEEHTSKNNGLEWIEKITIIKINAKPPEKPKKIKGRMQAGIGIMNIIPENIQHFT